MRENIKIVYPSYLEEFKCIGDKCEDNCCNGWEINIDKNTFDQYKGIEDEKMNKFINENIIIREKLEHLDIDYGQIKLTDANACPFLNEENYCIIHSKLGEEYLSNVCNTFPRVINKIDDYYEISPDVSCIEAARILLLKEERMKFKEDKTILKKYSLAMKLDTNSTEVIDTNFKYLKEIRNKSIKIIQNREYELSERLYILGKFLEITRKELCYNYDNLVEFISEYNIKLFSGKFKRNKENYMFQLSFYRDVLEKLNVFNEHKSDYFKKKIQEIILGYKLNKNTSLMDNHDMYVEAYYTCEREIFQKYSYIFENYLVNHMFKELFPFSESDVIINDYIMMLIRFS